MGSTSDWETMKAAAKVLEEFGVPYEAKAMSAHRTPHAVAEWAAGAQKNGMKAIIAAAGGAAHLAGVVAAHTTLPVLGVPMPSKHLQGLDSLLSTVQMPKGIPVATFAIGEAGAANAALFAVALLALSDTTLRQETIRLPREADRSGAQGRAAEAVSSEVRRAAQILRAGGLVAFPTETVYGLGADASSEKAVARLYAVKGRPADHPVIIHFASRRTALSPGRARFRDGARELARTILARSADADPEALGAGKGFRHRRPGHGRAARAFASGRAGNC